MDGSKAFPVTLSDVALALASGFCQQAQAGAFQFSPSYPAVEIPCPSALPTGEVEGETIVCGVETVPENYNVPDGRQIEITYALLRSQSLSSAPEPIIDLRGGLGATVLAASALSSRVRMYETRLRRRDLRGQHRGVPRRRRASYVGRRDSPRVRDRLGADRSGIPGRLGVDERYVLQRRLSRDDGVQ